MATAPAAAPATKLSAAEGRRRSPKTVLRACPTVRYVVNWIAL